jgi:hypothetical protein
MSNGDLDLNQVSLPDLVNQHINNAADLLMVSSRLLPGDRIDLFFALAANRPEVAFSAFMTILEGNADPTYRALALRGLGRIQHEPTLNEIRACESDDARELVQFLASELKGQGAHSNDLTRWAAADAMVNIEYSAYVLQMTGLGGIGEPPKRIAKEIVESYLAKGLRVERFDSQGETTAEYERFLDFWTFGPVERLFQEEMIHASDESMLLQELSFLGLEIIFRIKKACYNTAIRNVSEAFSNHNNNSHGAYSWRLTRFLNEKIPDSMVVQTINDVREVIRGDFVAPPNLDVTQQSLNDKTEVEIINMISFFEKNIAVTERNLEDLLVRVNGELMEDFLEKRFLLRQDWFSRNIAISRFMSNSSKSE